MAGNNLIIFYSKKTFTVKYLNALDIQYTHLKKSESNKEQSEIKSKFD